MSTFYVVEHTPKINETSIPRDTIVRVKFNKELNPNSVNYKVLTVRNSSYEDVDGVLGVEWTNKGQPDGRMDVLTFKPKSTWLAEETYTVYIHKIPDSVKSKDGDYIQETYKFTFTAGISVINNPEPTRLEQLQLDLEHAVSIKDYKTASEIQDLIDGILNPSNAVEPTTPTDVEVKGDYIPFPGKSASNVSLDDVKCIRIKFNKDVYNPTNIRITYNNVLG